MTEKNKLNTSHSVGQGLVIVGACDVKLWSLDVAERHRRAFAHFGVELLDEKTPKESVIAVRADYLLSTDLVAAISANRETVLTDTSGGIAVAVQTRLGNLDSVQALLRSNTFDRTNPSLKAHNVLGPEELGSSYDDILRKRATPFVLSYANTSIDVLEQKTFGAAYKGATDFVTKWCWPRPAKTVTRWSAALGLSPNTITTASLILVLLATWLFAEGYFLIAIPLAWAMTFLDTVDGKLARVTLTSTQWGNMYDHGIDLIHPPFWWWAWYVGVIPVATPDIASALAPALWIIVAGYVVGRLLEGLFVMFFKIETHIWQPLDFYFRTITARRNPNLAILTIATVCGRPDIGFIGVAVWTVVSLIFHGVRLLQAAILRAQGQPIVSWLNPTA